ncbi:non-specific lipid transfer protein GPI-anchored 16-like isoform X1 [Solanum dulcamara]|uniref:non-specific lipid transfer protein GPI-anchored 16-like isoform X1 n=1 Tax=Solanum dulcamara TaxID=45834 RepID=UPI0024862EDC|nr:non-specific lipid transfer protein GPI-anchored 16-like isoform X1 [Solanum dulcamara]
MENFKVSLSVHDIVLLTLILSFSGFKIVNGQINTACTSSIISTFTPCFNYLTGSSGNGSSPTEDCCNSLKSSMSDSIDCVCLIVTGNVPVSIPFIRTLALSLPQACNTGVPVQCSASGVPLPSPGPALFVPPPAPSPPPPQHHHAPAHPPRHHRAVAFPPALAPRGPRAAAPTAEVDPPSVEDDEPTMAASPPKPSLLPKTTLQNPNNTSASSYISSFSSPVMLMIIALVILFVDKS